MQPKPHRAQPASRGGERDPDRFYCPYPNCTRSFAELWRLKVHYRAPPDARGSGKERGHGCELQFCPKCEKELKAGKHHVGCFAGKAGPRQAAKRLKAQEEAAQAESAAMDFSRRRSAPVGDAWRPLPAGRDDFASPRGVMRPSYHTSRSHAASSQDSEASQPLEPSQKRRRMVEARCGLPGGEGGAALLRVHSSSLADVQALSMDAEGTIAFPLDLVELADAGPSTSCSEGTTGGQLQRTLSAPPLAAVQLGRPAGQPGRVVDTLFEFTSIFDGDALALDSPPPQGKRPPAGGVWNIHASSVSDPLLDLPPFGSLHDDHIMQAMFAELAQERPPPPHRRCASAHVWGDHGGSTPPAEHHLLDPPHPHPHAHVHLTPAPSAPLPGAHASSRTSAYTGSTLPMSPGGGGGHAGGLDALLLGFSSSNGESSPQHSGPGAARDSGAGLAFPSFGGDDLHFIQDARYGWNDKRILAPPEHPYFSLEAFTSHLGEDGRGQHKHSHSPLTPDALRHPSETDSRRWSPLSEQTHALSFRH